MAQALLGDGNVTASGVVRGDTVRAASLAKYEIGTTAKTSDLATELAAKAAQTPTFTEAAALANLAGSGETQETMWGKVKKAITDFIAHLTDSTAHSSIFALKANVSDFTIGSFASYVSSLFSGDNTSLANTMNGGTDAILQAGSNITLTQDATTKKVTIAATGGGTTWVDKTSSSSPFTFNANTFNQLPQFTSGQQVTFVLPVPTGNECIDVYAYVDLSGIAAGGTVPIITTTVPTGKTANLRNYVGDTMARGKVYTIAYKIMPTATANTFTVISKITELKGFSPFYLDANGYVVVDTENVRVDGTVEYDGDVLSDGTIEIEVN